MKSYKEAVQYLACISYALCLINDPWTRDHLKTRIRGAIDVISYLYDVEADLILEDLKVEVILGSAGINLGNDDA